MRFIPKMNSKAILSLLVVLVLLVSFVHAQTAEEEEAATAEAEAAAQEAEQAANTAQDRQADAEAAALQAQEAGNAAAAAEAADAAEEASLQAGVARDAARDAWTAAQTAGADAGGAPGVEAAIIAAEESAMAANDAAAAAWEAALQARAAATAVAEAEQAAAQAAEAALAAEAARDQAAAAATEAEDAANAVDAAEAFERAAERALEAVGAAEAAADAEETARNAADAVDSAAANAAVVAAAAAAEDAAAAAVAAQASAAAAEDAALASGGGCPMRMAGQPLGVGSGELSDAHHFRSTTPGSEWSPLPYGTKLHRYRKDLQDCTVTVSDGISSDNCDGHRPNEHQWDAADYLVLQCSKGFFFSEGALTDPLNEFEIRCEHDDWWHYGSTSNMGSPNAWFYHDEAFMQGRYVPKYNYQCKPCGFKDDTYDSADPHPQCGQAGPNEYCPNYTWNSETRICQFDTTTLTNWINESDNTCDTIEEEDCWFRSATYLLVEHASTEATRNNADTGKVGALEYLCGDGADRIQNRNALKDAMLKDLLKLKPSKYSADGSEIGSRTIGLEGTNGLDFTIVGCPSRSDRLQIPINLTVNLNLSSLHAKDFLDGEDGNQVVVDAPGEALFHKIINEQVWGLSFSGCDQATGCSNTSFESETDDLRRRLNFATQWAVQGTLIIPENAREAGVPVSTQSFPWWAGLIVGVVVLGGAGGGFYYWWSKKSERAVIKTDLKPVQPSNMVVPKMVVPKMVEPKVDLTEPSLARA